MNQSRRLYSKFKVLQNTSRQILSEFEKCVSSVLDIKIDQYLGLVYSNSDIGIVSFYLTYYTKIYVKYIPAVGY